MQYIPPNQQQGVSGEEFQEIFSVFLSLSALCVCKLSIAICWQTELSQKSVAYHYKIFVCLFVLIFKLYNIVLVLPYFSMNPPQVCTRSPSWTLLPPPSPYHPYKEHPGLISFRMDWLDLLAVQGTLKSLLQHHSSKASILRCSAFFTVQLSHPYMNTGKTIAWLDGHLLAK